MAHAAELPNKYVCTECQVVHAGTVVDHTDGSHVYEPPTECGVCGASELVGEADWPHHHD